MGLGEFERAMLAMASSSSTEASSSDFSSSSVNIPTIKDNIPRMNDSGQLEIIMWVSILIDSY